MALNKIQRRQRIHYRIRKVVNGTAERPRMVVFRSNKQIYVQLVDDLKAVTLCAAASNDKALAAECKGKSGIEAAAIVGKAIAQKALAAGINTVCFDRGGYLYHGRVKSLAEAAREGGLKF
ncbi:MAG: 50S ribosomal protein L18 [Bacteroidales bacterium]|nr:50S ribosomal protein L18 [Bacteroidales bacterium]